MPAGYYQVPGLPYPRTPTDPNRNRDLLGNVVDTAMEPDMGVGAQPPRDPYMASLPPRQPSAPTTPPVTTLQPGRTTPFSRADAQALAALDPRALDEAKALAAMPESTPAKMTGTFGGRSFEMQPSARVDRNALARLYAQAQERKGQERQDAVRGQEQAGKERIVSIPGEQATKRREMELGTEERITGKKLEADAPARAADIAAKQAQTAAATGAEARAQAEAARQPQQQQQAAIDAALAEAQASPFAQTPEGRARIAALAKQSTVGKVVPEAAASAAGPQRSVSEVGAEMIADPIVAAALKRARDLKAGHWSGSQGRRDSAAASALLQRAVEDFARRNGVDPMELRPFLALGG